MAMLGKYDMGVPRHRHLFRRQVARIAPDLRTDDLHGAIRYYDCQVDDARLVVTVARTAAAHGAHVATRTRVTGFLREGERVVGVRARDLETGRELEVRARVVVNAAGVWTDEIQEMVGGRGALNVQASKGIHLVVPRDRIRSEAGFITRTEKSVLFVIPWGRHWIIGTTDTAWNLDKAHPAASTADIDYLLGHVNAMLASRSTTTTSRACTPGCGRCCAASREPTSRISREHTVVTPVPGLVMIAGGKLTTYRVMAQGRVDAAAHSLRTTVNTTVRPSITDRVPLVGAEGFEARTNQRVALARRSGLHVGPDRPPARPVRRPRRRGARPGRRAPRAGRAARRAPRTTWPAEVVYAVTHEGARHLDDVLTRRTRISIETFDRGVARGPAGRRADGRRARLGRRPASTTRSTTTCAGSRPSGRASSQLTDQEADEARVSAPDIV